MNSEEKDRENLWFLNRFTEPQDDDEDEDYRITFATLYAEAGDSDDDEEIDESLTLDLDLGLDSELLLRPRKSKDSMNKEKTEKEKERERKRARERERIKDEDDTEDDDDDEDDDSEEEREREREEREREKEREKQREKEKKEKEKQKRKKKEKEQPIMIAPTECDAAWIADFFSPLSLSDAKKPAPPVYPYPEPDDILPLCEDNPDMKFLDDWLVKEGINEPLSDIPEYNLLLDLAADFEKNYEILLKVLTPTTVILNSDDEGEMMDVDTCDTPAQASPADKITPDKTELHMEIVEIPDIDMENPEMLEADMDFSEFTETDIEYPELLETDMEYPEIPETDMDIPEIPETDMESPPPLSPSAEELTSDVEEPNPPVEEPNPPVEDLVPMPPVITPKKFVRPVPNFDILIKTPSVPVDHSQVEDSPMPWAKQSSSPRTPPRRGAKQKSVKTVTPKNTKPMPVTPVTPKNKGVMPVTPTNKGVMPGTPTFRVVSAMPGTPTIKGAVPVMPGTPTFRVVPALPGTPTIKGVIPVLPGTPTIKGVVPVTPGTPTLKVAVPVLPGTPKFRVVPAMPITPTRKGAVPPMPVTPTNRGIMSPMPGTPTNKIVMPMPKTPTTPVTPKNRRAKTPPMPRTPIPPNPIARPPMLKTPAPKKGAKKAAAPKKNAKQSGRVEKAKANNSKDSIKSMAEDNATRKANDITTAIFSKKKAAAPITGSRPVTRSTRANLAQLTVIDLPPPKPRTVVPPLPPAVPPPPPPPSTEDQQEIRAWLQLSSGIVVKQVQYVEAKDKKEKEENEGKPVKESKPKPSDPATPTTTVLFDVEILGLGKPQVTLLSTKWFEQFGSESVNNLRRPLELPVGLLDIGSTRVSTKFRILRRSMKREVIFVDLKYTNSYCILHLNTSLDLRVSAGALDRAVFKHGFDVVQHSYDTIRMTWIWADGTVMIINGTSQAALVETQQKLLPKLVDMKSKKSSDFKTEYLTLISQTTFPWTVDLREFSHSETLCGPLFSERHVYYVTREMPGIVARVFATGEVQVFAMTLAPADAMFIKLYPILSRYRVTDD